MSRCGIVVCAVCSLLAPAMLQAQKDPGPQGGPPDAGRPLQGLSPTELATFQEGLKRFIEVDSVSGTEPGATGTGLGPRFNLNGCAGCHVQPAIGGSSPAGNSPQNPRVNPQVAIATEYGAQNKVPSFIQPNGPVRAARFVKAPDGSLDGGVQSLYVISGRADAGTCAAEQPDFDTAVANNNVVFRIPIPLFGDGLVEAIPDSVILANEAANAVQKAAFGISGHVNRSENDDSVMRFGWKAQTRSLEMFAGEAYNVEIGVTNDLFPSERDQSSGCDLNPTPEDTTDFTAASPVAAMADIEAFAQFIRWLAPPAPPANSPQNARGQQVFQQVGCALCHTPVLTTGNTASAALRNRNVPLYSDLLVHNMGAGLADGIEQGQAQGNEFRTAPLWGLGQRVYLLHDGRTTDLVQAIRAHAGGGSEANASIAQFNALPQNAMQDLLAFLRSL